MVLNKFYFKETNAKKVKETHLFLSETLQEINFTLKKKNRNRTNPKELVPRELSKRIYIIIYMHKKRLHYQSKTNIFPCYTT